MTSIVQHNRPFPSSPGPLFQNKGRCSAFDMKLIFHSHANKTHFHKEGCAPSLILKVDYWTTGRDIFSPSPASFRLLPPPSTELTSLLVSMGSGPSSWSIGPGLLSNRCFTLL